MGIPKITRLLDEADYISAFEVAEELEREIPKDPELVELWEELSVVCSIETSPEGADTYVKGYQKFEDVKNT